MIFVKHIFDFSQTATQICFKFCGGGGVLRWTSTKFVIIGLLPLFKMELLVILCIFWPILRFEKKLNKLFVKNWECDDRSDTFIDIGHCVDKSVL